MYTDRCLALPPLLEVLPFQHPCHCVMACKPDEVLCLHLGHPSGVEINYCFFRVKYLEYLFLVGLCILKHLFTCEGGSCLVFSRGITDHPGKISDQEDHLMAEFLELAHLLNKHGVSKVYVRCCGVKACLYPEGTVLLELFEEFLLSDDLNGTPFDNLHLFFRRKHG